MKKALTNLVAVASVAVLAGLTTTEAMRVGGYTDCDGAKIGRVASYDLLSGGIAQDCNTGSFYEPLDANIGL